MISLELKTFIFDTSNFYDTSLFLACAYGKWTTCTQGTVFQGKYVFDKQLVYPILHFKSYLRYC